MAKIPLIRSQPVTTIIVVALLAVFAAVLTRLQGSWSSPAPLFVGFWVLALALPPLAGYPGTPDAVLTLGALVMSWALGSLAGCDLNSRIKNTVSAAPSLRCWRTEYLGHLAKAGGVTGAAAAYLVVRQTGFHPSSLLSLEGLFQVGNSAAVQRYRGVTEGSPSVSALLMITYLGALAAPRWLLFDQTTRRRTLYAAMPIAGAVLYSAVSTARTAMIICFVLWIGSYLSCRAYLGREVRLRPATILGATAVASAGAALFLGIAFVRIGGVSGQASHKITKKTEAYAFGYLPAYSAWQTPHGTTSLDFRPRDKGWGSLTFNGVAKFLGGNPEDSEPYSEFIPVDQHGNHTNIFTFFRGALEDFGRAGAALLLAIGGFVASRAYEKMRRQRRLGSLFTVTALTAAIPLTSSYSIFYFTNVCGALILDAVIFCTLGIRK